MIFLRRHGRATQVGFFSYLLTFPLLLIGTVPGVLMAMAILIYGFGEVDPKFGEGGMFFIGTAYWIMYGAPLTSLSFAVNLLFLPPVRRGYAHRLFITALLIGAIIPSLLLLFTGVGSYSPPLLALTEADAFVFATLWWVMVAVVTVGLFHLASRLALLPRPIIPTENACSELRRFDGPK